MNGKLKSIAIVGGGPAGATLGALLAQEGYKTGIFHTDKRPPLIVGESLLPAVVPMLRKLGVEEVVKSFSVHKPGATVCLSLDEIIPAVFRWADGTLPNYAYNTPRDLFDAALLDRARQSGATIFGAAAKLEKADAADGVRLARGTVDATDGFFGDGPDLIVDASGRVRLISRLLETPVLTGGREDISLFAHLDTVQMNDPGNVHIDYLTKGWSWRIPLPGRASVGVVIHPRHLGQYGSSIESQYDGFLKDEPSLKVYTRDSKRITPVVKYNNYQVISQKMCGPGWAMLGDAAGFIDPIFSTGLYLGMKGAFELLKAIQSTSPGSMQRYEEERLWELTAWQGVINSWYSGRLFNLYRAGQKYKNTIFGARIERRVQRRLIRIFNGQAVDDAFNMRIFDYLIALGAVVRNPSDLVVA